MGLAGKLNLIGEELLATTVALLDKLGIKENEILKYIEPCMRYIDDKTETGKLSMILFLSSKYIYDKFSYEEADEGIFTMRLKDELIIDELRNRGIMKSRHIIDICDYIDYIAHIDDYEIGSDKYVFNCFEYELDLLDDMIYNGKEKYGLKIETTRSKDTQEYTIYKGGGKIAELIMDIGNSTYIHPDGTFRIDDKNMNYQVKMDMNNKLESYLKMIDIITNKGSEQSQFNSRQMYIITNGIRDISLDKNLTLKEHYINTKLFK